MLQLTLLARGHLQVTTSCEQKDDADYSKDAHVFMSERGNTSFHIRAKQIWGVSIHWTFLGAQPVLCAGLALISHCYKSLFKNIELTKYHAILKIKPFLLLKVESSCHVSDKQNRTQ